MRGRNLRAKVERCAHPGEHDPHAEPPRSSIPSTVAMVVLVNGHYSQLRITPRPLARRWDLDAVDSILPRDMELQDGF